MNTFIATLQPMLTLFVCMAVGFILRKTNILSHDAGKTMAKLETWVFCPALNFSTMATFFSLATIKNHAVNVLFGVVTVTLSVLIAVPLAKCFARQKNAERGVYRYALAFANSGYVGDPVVLALFGDLALSYYKLFGLPITIMIYTWGISNLVPDGERKGSPLKKLLNAPTVGLLLGMVAGMTGLGARMPVFLTSTLNSLKGCMGPVAMLLAGFTVANYDIKQMLLNKKVYVATALRLVVIPAIILSALFGIKELAVLLWNVTIGNAVLFLAFFAIATPLGLNTVVFPEAYGGDPKLGASMAMISHTLCVVTIPLLYALMVWLFGAVAFV